MSTVTSERLRIKMPKPPKGFLRWEYRGKNWVNKNPVTLLYVSPYFTEADGSQRYEIETAEAIGSPGDYYEAIKSPAPKPRRESLTARMETAVQIGQREGKSAHEIVREINRLLDNHQRAKRRKEGK